MASPERQLLPEQYRLLCNHVHWQGHHFVHQQKAFINKSPVQSPGQVVVRIPETDSTASVCQEPASYVSFEFDDSDVPIGGNEHPQSKSEHNSNDSKAAVFFTPDHFGVQRDEFVREGLSSLFWSLLFFLVAIAVFSFTFGGQMVAWRMARFTKNALRTCEEREAATTTIEKICAPSAMINGLCSIVGLIDNILKNT